MYNHLTFKIFFSHPVLQYGISTKTDGAMELAVDGLLDIPNRRNFINERGLEHLTVISPRQTHSNRPIWVSGEIQAEVSGDAVVTGDRSKLLSVTIADCFPVYFFNPKSHIIGLAHSGWRGTVANIAAKTLEMMGPNSQDVLVGIGPGIQSCHFEIQGDVVSAFDDYPDLVLSRKGKLFVDLPKIITRQLVEKGVLPENIETCGECTYCRTEKYFSYRRDKPKKIQEMLAYIAIAKI